MQDIIIITREQQQTTMWAGGTTTQIAIYPPISDYGNRDFLWRLSTAVVEIEESNFTRLQGFDRHLMILEGELQLVHKQHHTTRLKQYEQDTFKGEWETISYGKARDFNLMLREGIAGRLQQYSLAVKQSLEMELEADSNKQCFLACYCYKGDIEFTAGEKKASLKEMELLLIQYNDFLKITAENIGFDECSLIAAFIEM